MSFGGNRDGGGRGGDRAGREGGREGGGRGDADGARRPFFRRKKTDPFSGAGAPKIDFVFTVSSEDAGEVHPMWPGHPITAHWGLDDPAKFKGTDDEKARYFSRIYGQLHARIRILTSLPLDKLGREALQKKLDDAGQS